MQKAIAKEDLSEEIPKGSLVDIIPEYSYLFEKRVKEAFGVRPGEVVVRKNDGSCGTTSILRVCKTKRNMLQFVD